MSGRLRTVLIFAHECAPHHRPQSTVGAQRPAQFAKHLPAYGWRAVVICCDALTRGQGTSAALAALPALIHDRLHRADPDKSVVIATPSLPYDGLLDRCWRSLQPQHGRTSHWKTALRRPLTAAKFLTGDYSQAWQPFGWRAAEAVARQVSIDACIGEHGPDAGLFLARAFSRRHVVPWLADFRDPILQPLRPAARALYSVWARRLVKTAAATINVTPVWTDMDRQQLGRPAHYIPNGFDPDEFGDLSCSPTSDRLTIAYAGSINRVQRLEIFLDGLRLACDRLGPEAPQQIRFHYRGDAGALVSRLAVERRLNTVVDTSPPVPREQALAELARADLLLLLSVAFPEREDKYFHRGWFPAKAFEYFGLRRPILCVPGDAGLLDGLITETRTGVICRNPVAIADYILMSWQRLTAGVPLPYDVNGPAVATYTRRVQAGTLSVLLDQFAGVSRRPRARNLVDGESALEGLAAS